MEKDGGHSRYIGELLGSTASPVLPGCGPHVAAIWPGTWAEKSLLITYRVKKAIVYDEMCRRWNVAWVNNWHSSADLLYHPQKSADRIARRTRLQDDSYQIPFFDDDAFELMIPPLTNKNSWTECSLDQAILTGLEELSRLVRQITVGAATREDLQRRCLPRASQTMKLNVEWYQNIFVNSEALERSRTWKQGLQIQCHFP